MMGNFIEFDAAAIRERLGAPSVIESPRVAAAHPAQV